MPEAVRAVERAASCGGDDGGADGGEVEVKAETEAEAAKDTRGAPPDIASKASPAPDMGSNLCPLLDLREGCLCWRITLWPLSLAGATGLAEPPLLRRLRRRSRERGLLPRGDGALSPTSLLVETGEGAVSGDSAEGAGGAGCSGGGGGAVAVAAATRAEAAERTRRSLNSWSSRLPRSKSQASSSRSDAPTQSCATWLEMVAGEAPGRRASAAPW